MAEALVEQAEAEASAIVSDAEAVARSRHAGDLGVQLEQAGSAMERVIRASQVYVGIRSIEILVADRGAPRAPAHVAGDDHDADRSAHQPQDLIGTRIRGLGVGTEVLRPRRDDGGRPEPATAAQVRTDVGFAPPAGDRRLLGRGRHLAIEMTLAAAVVLALVVVLALIP